MNSQRLQQYPQSLARWSSRAERRKAHMTLPPNRINEGLARVGCMPSRTQLTDNKLSGIFGASLSHNVMLVLLIHSFAYVDLFLVPSLGLLPFILSVCFVFFCFSIPVC